MTEPAIVLGANQYGKAEVRVVKVTRDTARHEIDDLNVTSQLRGDFAAAHLEGDNAHVVATDTQKNTIFAFARDGIGSPEAVPAAPGRPLHGLVRLGERRAVGGRAVRVGTHRRARLAPRPRVRAIGAGGAHRRRRRRRCRAARARGTPQPHRAEDHRVGIRGVPARPVHDAAGDLRPHPGHGCRGAMALRPARWTPPRSSAGRPRLRRHVRERADAAARGLHRALLGRTADDPVRHGQPRARAACRDRRDPPLDAEQAPLRRRPRPVRARQSRTRCSSPPTAPTDSSRRP